MERKEKFQTPSGIEVRPVEEGSSRGKWSAQEDLGMPGQFPFTRGIYPNMYRGKLWTMRQYAGFGTAAETNERFRYLLGQGQTGLSVAFDLPTQMGYDSTHSLAEGEVGKVGVAISSLDDLRRLFQGVSLREVSTSMTINATASILLSMYLAVAEEQGVAHSQISGTVQNDILKEYLARGTYIFPPEPSMRLVTDLIEFCTRHLPRFNPISISGYHMREAGCTAIQEIAFTLCNAKEYIRAALGRKLQIDQFAPRLSFFFASHSYLLEEIAKFRAARRLWARIMKEEFRAQDPRSMMLRFHTQTGGCTLTAQQPLNNAVRVAYQALAAVLGGTQSLHTNAYDEALSLPTQESASLALRTQQILAHECGVGDTVDPLGGSFFLEDLTSRLEEEASGLIAKVESRGGVLAALRDGSIQDAIHQSAYRHQKQVESGEEVVVGVNQFVTDESADGSSRAFSVLHVDPSLELEQKERLRKFLEKRDPGKARASLRVLAEGAGGQENLVPFILQAVRAGATLGEICSTLSEEFGTHDQQVTS